MKNVIVICLATLLLAASPAQVSSYYSEGKQLLISGNITEITTASFTQRQEGFYRLDGNTFTTQYKGLVHLSGRCLLKRAPEVLTFYLTVNGGNPVMLTTQPAESFTLAYTFPAGNVVLSVYTESQYGANGLNCNLLFEKVK
jgi:hypothetical protein